MRTWPGVLMLVLAMMGGAATAWAQTGSIDGHVVDAETRDDLIGVDVVLVGSGKTAQTDVDGKFAFPDLTPGTYNLKVTYLGYAPQDVKLIQVNAGKATAVNIRLEAAEAFATEDVVVTADRIRTTETAVLTERKEAVVVGDAISAAQVQKSPDGTSGDALKRVTGLTVVDGQYVFVRGVTDRYNATELNGIGVTSTNTHTDRKSFSFDLVPANLLANTTVIKTATPDMPGDFTGGLVRVSTLEFPDQPTTNISVSAGRRAEVTGEEGYQLRVRGDHDWLGWDDGTRDFPEDLPRSNRQELNALGRALPNSWGVSPRTTPPKYSFSLSHGNHFDVLGDQLGLVAAVSYRNSYDQGPLDIGGDTGESTTNGGFEYKADLLWGGLLNLNWKFDDNHRLGVKNSYNRSASQNILLTEGLDSSKRFKRQAEEWEAKSMLLNEVDGHHRFPLFRNLAIDWRGYYNENDATKPDARFIEYNTDDPEFPIMDGNLRTWTWLDEFRRGADVDVTIPLSESDGSGKLKVGVSNATRRRSFDIEAFSATPRDLAWSPSWLPPDSIFAPELFGADRGWDLTPSTLFSGKYDARHDVRAYYGMIDAPFAVHGQNFRVAGGVRLENSDQVVAGRVAEDRPDALATSRISSDDYLPSANLAYLATAKLNIRVAYFKSLNRPEFRELAAVAFNDFNNDAVIIGNPDLKRALVDNYDVRAEYFPNLGEVISVSFFDKYFADAIEEHVVFQDGRKRLTWYNAEVGRNYGLELEARRSLGFVAESLAAFSVGANYTRVWSSVDFDDVRAVYGPDGESLTPEPFTNTRPMQGQAPWSANASVSWEQPAWGTSITFLYNENGRRLAAVGSERARDVYDDPRSVVDLAATQRLAGTLKLRATIKDLLGKDVVQTQGPDKTSWSTRAGDSEYTLSLSAQF